MKEVEKRAKLNPSQTDALVTKLKDMGAEESTPKIIVDIYYAPKAVKSFAEIEMNKVGSYSLRLRQETVGKSTKVELNTKVIANEGDHSAWDEYEIEVGNLEQAEKILAAIGFKEYFRLVKTRTSYKLGNMTVEYEDIKDFAPVIEVEVLTDEGEEEGAKVAIMNFLEDAGITKDQIFPKSVTNYLMHEWAKF